MTSAMQFFKRVCTIDSSEPPFYRISQGSMGMLLVGLTTMYEDKGLKREADDQGFTVWTFPDESILTITPSGGVHVE